VKAAAAAEMENEKPKDYLTRRRNGCTVAGVQLDNNTARPTKRTKIFSLQNLMMITVAGVNSTTTQH
jgi:hypothetical protein